jgi:hypothetical protein
MSGVSLLIGDLRRRFGFEHCLGDGLPTARLTEFAQEPGMGMVDTPPSALFKPSLQRDLLLDGGPKGGFDNDSLNRTASILGFSYLG